MSRLNLNPDPAVLAKFGTLAYVSKKERQRIFDLPSGQFKPAVRDLEKAIKASLKAKKQEEDRANQWGAQDGKR